MIHNIEGNDNFLHDYSHFHWKNIFKCIWCDFYKDLHQTKMPRTSLHHDNINLINFICFKFSLTAADHFIKSTQINNVKNQSCI